MAFGNSKRPAATVDSKSATGGGARGAVGKTTLVDAARPAPARGVAPGPGAAKIGAASSAGGAAPVAHAPAPAGVAASADSAHPAPPGAVDAHAAAPGAGNAHPAPGAVDAHAAGPGAGNAHPAPGAVDVHAAGPGAGNAHLAPPGAGGFHAAVPSAGSAHPAPPGAGGTHAAVIGAGDAHAAGAGNGHAAAAAGNGHAVTTGAGTGHAAPGADTAHASGTLAQQLMAAATGGTLDAHHVSQIINAPGVTAAEQAQLARDSAAVALIRKSFHSQRADQVLTILAGNSAAFRAALMPPGAFTTWVMEDRAHLWTTMTATGGDWAGWVNTFRRLDAWRAVLDLSADSSRRAVLRPHVVQQWNWLMMSVPKPVATKAQADAILHLYGDGAGISLNDKYLTWTALFRSRLAGPGQNRSYPAGTTPGWTWETIYVAVAPDDDAMNLFFHQFRQMPRAHVDTASGVAMVHVQRTMATNAANSGDIWYANGAGGFSQSAVDFPIPTSYYMPDNWIVMRSTSAAGTPEIGRIEDNGLDSAAVNTPGVDPLSGGRVKPMTMFQNHATHEVGHAVGARVLRRGRYHVSGDDWAMAYGNWAQDGSSDGYAAMCGWTAAMDAASYQLKGSGGTPHPVPGSSIKDFLVGLVEAGMSGMAAHPVAIMLGGVQAALLSFTADRALASSLLVQNVSAVYDSLPDSAYTIKHGIAPVSKVHFFCTRWGNRWVTYDAACWRNKVSHYGLSSHKEMFAEMYTAKFTGAGVPIAHNSHDPEDFFNALQEADPAELGLPAYRDPGAVGAGAPAAPGAPAQQADPHGHAHSSTPARGARSAARSRPHGPVPRPPGKPL